MILVITDHNELRGNVRELFELSDYEVLELACPPDEIAEIDTFELELIVYCSSTDENGSAFIRAIQGLSIEQVPMIFLTNDHQPNHKNPSHGGKRVFVQLPFEVGHLLKLSEDYLSRSTYI